MRARKRKKTRSLLPLDLYKIYRDGMSGCVLRPMKIPAPSDLDFTIEFCEEILARDPEHFEALALAGESYTRRGDYEKGLQTDLALSRLRPDNGVVQYNLACSYALNGLKDEAFDALERAVDLGYQDLDHLLHDRDLEIPAQRRALPLADPAPDAARTGSGALLNMGDSKN